MSCKICHPFKDFRKTCLGTSLGCLDLQAKLDFYLRVKKCKFSISQEGQEIMNAKGGSTIKVKNVFDMHPPSPLSNVEEF